MALTPPFTHIYRNSHHLLSSSSRTPSLPAGHPPTAGAPLPCQMKSLPHHPHVFLKGSRWQRSIHTTPVNPRGQEELQGCTASSVWPPPGPFLPSAPTPAYLGPWTDGGWSPSVFCHQPTHCTCRKGLVEVCHRSTCSSQTWDTSRSEGTKLNCVPQLPATLPAHIPLPPAQDPGCPTHPSPVSISSGQSMAPLRVPRGWCWGR